MCHLACGCELRTARSRVSDSKKIKEQLWRSEPHMWARLLLHASAVDRARDFQIFSLALSQVSYRGDDRILETRHYDHVNAQLSMLSLMREGQRNLLV